MSLFVLTAIASAGSKISSDLQRVCLPLLPAVASATATITQLKVGNSNALYCLERSSGESIIDRHLIRVFGGSTALALDRDEENRVFERLSANGLAPPLVATFDGGRIEGWLGGRPCSAAECRTPEVFRPVARSLAALHAFDDGSSADAGDAKEPWGWIQAKTWMAGARRNIATLLEEERLPELGLQRRLQAIDLDRIQALLDELRAELSARPTLHLCYCHNDLSNTNVHRDDAVVRLIDFEFGGRNLRGFDIATHLSHWAGGAVDGRYDDTAFPTAAEVTSFLQEYARATTPTLEEADALAAALAVEVEAATPLAHACWGLWALCALPRPEGNAATAGSAASGNDAEGSDAESEARFSHIEYAERRLAAFEQSLARLQEHGEAEAAGSRAEGGSRGASESLATTQASQPRASQPRAGTSTGDVSDFGLRKQYISLCGMIGAGKTTLATALGERLSLPVYYEPVRLLNGSKARERREEGERGGKGVSRPRA